MTEVIKAFMNADWSVNMILGFVAWLITVLGVLWFAVRPSIYYIHSLYKKVQQKRSEQMGREIYNAFQLDTLKTKLEAYGKVVQCEEKNGMFHVKITDGFMPHFFTVRSCVADITGFVGNAYPYIHKNVTDTNLFHCILKPTR